MAALDLWLVKEPSPWLRAVLRALDPHPYRDAVRDAITAKNRELVAKLAAKPEALGQPAGFAAALGQHQRTIPVERRRRILEAALRGQHGNLSLLMSLGGSYLFNQREGADERLRWSQAAVAAHPHCGAAHGLLAVALGLSGRGDPTPAYREAIRLDPMLSATHYNYGIHLVYSGDLDGALAEFTEAIRLDPKYATAHVNLGVVLRNKKDLDAAIAEYKEAIQLDPKLAHAAQQPGDCAGRKGKPRWAIAELAEAIRLDPKTLTLTTTWGRF